MNDHIEDEPAFPVFPDTSIGHASAHRGATLRDYFAAKAMNSFLSGHISHYGHDNHWAFDSLADCSYEVADAMLKARKVP